MGIIRKSLKKWHINWALRIEEASTKVRYGGFQAMGIASVRRRPWVKRKMHFRDQKRVNVVRVQAAKGRMTGNEAGSSLGLQRTWEISYFFSWSLYSKRGWQGFWDSLTILNKGQVWSDLQLVFWVNVLHLRYNTQNRYTVLKDDTCSFNNSLLTKENTEVLKS